MGTGEPGDGAGGCADRTRAEALRESETLFRTLADTAPVMIWMSDTEKRGTFFNKGWLDFTGRALEEELGHGWTQSVHPEDMDRCLTACGGAFRARRPFSIDCIHRLRLLMEKGEVRQQAVDVNEVVLDVLRIVSSDLLIQEVTAHTELASDLPTVSGDRVQFQQVLLNLILNGCHAMTNGSARERRLVLRTEAWDGAGVQVTVSDRGVGIPAEDLDRVFEPFFTTHAGGMGLGLAVCRSIIRAHGGTLRASNNEGGGASFQFTLPGTAPFSA